MSRPGSLKTRESLQLGEWGSVQLHIKCKHSPSQLLVGLLLGLPGPGVPSDPAPHTHLANGRAFTFRSCVSRTQRTGNLGSCCCGWPSAGRSWQEVSLILSPPSFFVYPQSRKHSSRLSVGKPRTQVLPDWG